MKTLLTLGLLLVGLQAWANVPVHEDRNEAEYNKQFSVGLNGYDPVSYFAEGGGGPQKGSADVTFTYGTIVYHFVNEANKDTFKHNPLKYEPTYGSYCAYAMSEGSKIEINPLIFTIHGNRAHFFVNKSAKKSFDSELKEREPVADQNWKDFSGEEPRL